MATQRDDTDGRSSITVEQQAKFAVTGDSSDADVVSVPDEPVGTTLDDFGADLDMRERETRIDQPTASRLTADDRPKDDEKIGASRQEPLFADVEEDQAALDGDDAHLQPMFDEADQSADDAEASTESDTQASEKPSPASEKPDGKSSDETNKADETDETDGTDEADADLLDGGIIEAAGVSHRPLRQALTDTDYDASLTSISGVGEEVADRLRDVRCPDTAILAVAWASDDYHDFVVSAFSSLPVNHRECAITEIEALYDDVLASVVEPTAAWTDDASTASETETDPDADSPVVA